MAVRNYFIKAEGWDGRTYEVVLTDTREASGSSTLEAEQNFLQMGGGEKDDDRTRPLWPREAQLSFLNTEPIGPLATGTGKDIRAEVRQDNTNATIMKGYVVSNEYQDAPLGPQPTTIQLPIIDGLPLLRDIGFDEIEGTPHLWPEISVARLLYLLLNELYPSNQPIEVALNRYPETSTLTSSDCPLQEVTLDPDNYRESRPAGSEWWNCYDVLKDVLQCFGLICRQTERRSDAVWHIRPPEEAAGSLKLWEIQQDQTVVLNTSADISRSIAADTVDLRVGLDHARDFQQPRREIQFTHALGSEINYVVNGGFEELTPPGDPQDWTLGSTWTNEVVSHSSVSKSPGATGSNEYLARITADSDQSTVQWGFQQQFPLVLGPDAIEMSWEGYEDIDFLPKMKCKIGSYVLSQNTTTLQVDAREGETILLVDPVEVPIPAGFDLKIFRSGSFIASATVEERAPAGSTTIKATTSAAADGGDTVTYMQFYDEANISDEYFAADAFMEPNSNEWTEASVRAALQTSNGTKVTGREIDVRVGGINTSGTNVEFGFDNLAVQPVIGGQVAERSVSTANTGESGKIDELESRLGSGPAARGLEKVRAFPSFANTWTPTDIDASNNTITTSGDNRRELEAGNPVYLARQQQNTGFYIIEAVAYDTDADTTTVSVDPDIHAIRTPASVGSNTELRAFFSRDFNPIYWGIGPDPQTTWPLHELIARKRLRHVRGNLDRLEFTLYVEDDIDPVQPHEYVTVGGTDYTVSALEFTPNNRGEQSVTLLRHNDFGT